MPDKGTVVGSAELIVEAIIVANEESIAVAAEKFQAGLKAAAEEQPVTERPRRGRVAGAADDVAVDATINPKIASGSIAKLIQDELEKVSGEGYQLTIDTINIREQIQHALEAPFNITINAEVKGAMAHFGLGDRAEPTADRGAAPQEIVDLMFKAAAKGKGRVAAPFVGGIDAVYRNINEALTGAGKGRFGRQSLEPGNQIEKALEMVDQFGEKVSTWVTFSGKGAVQKPSGGSILTFLKDQGVDVTKDPAVKTLTDANIGAFGGDNRRSQELFFARLKAWAGETVTASAPAASQEPTARAARETVVTGAAERAEPIIGKQVEAARAELKKLLGDVPSQPLVPEEFSQFAPNRTRKTRTGRIPPEAEVEKLVARAVELDEMISQLDDGLTAARGDTMLQDPNRLISLSPDQRKARNKLFDERDIIGRQLDFIGYAEEAARRPGGPTPGHPSDDPAADARARDQLKGMRASYNTRSLYGAFEPRTINGINVDINEELRAAELERFHNVFKDVKGGGQHRFMPTTDAEDERVRTLRRDPRAFTYKGRKVQNVNPTDAFWTRVTEKYDEDIAAQLKADPETANLVKAAISQGGAAKPLIVPQAPRGGHGSGEAGGLGWGSGRGLNQGVEAAHRLLATLDAISQTSAEIDSRWAHINDRVAAGKPTDRLEAGVRDREQHLEILRARATDLAGRASDIGSERLAKMATSAGIGGAFGPVTPEQRKLMRVAANLRDSLEYAGSGGAYDNASQRAVAEGVGLSPEEKLKAFLTSPKTKGRHGREMVEQKLLPNWDAVVADITKRAGLETVKGEDGKDVARPPDAQRERARYQRAIREVRAEIEIGLPDKGPVRDESDFMFGGIYRSLFGSKDTVERAANAPMVVDAREVRGGQLTMANKEADRAATNRESGRGRGRVAKVVGSRLTGRQTDQGRPETEDIYDVPTTDLDREVMRISGLLAGGEGHVGAVEADRKAAKDKVTKALSAVQKQFGGRLKNTAGMAGGAELGAFESLSFKDVPTTNKARARFDKLMKGGRGRVEPESESAKLQAELVRLKEVRRESDAVLARVGSDNPNVLNIGGEVGPSEPLRQVPTGGAQTTIEHLQAMALSSGDVRTDVEQSLATRTAKATRRPSTKESREMLTGDETRAKYEQDYIKAGGTILPYGKDVQAPFANYNKEWEKQAAVPGGPGRPTGAPEGWDGGVVHVIVDNLPLQVTWADGEPGGGGGGGGGGGPVAAAADEPEEQAAEAADKIRGRAITFMPNEDQGTYSDTMPREASGALGSVESKMATRGRQGFVQSEAARKRRLASTVNLYDKSYAAVEKFFDDKEAAGAPAAEAARGSDITFRANPDQGTYSDVMPRESSGALASVESKMAARTRKGFTEQEAARRKQVASTRNLYGRSYTAVEKYFDDLEATSAPKVKRGIIGTPSFARAQEEAARAGVELNEGEPGGVSGLLTSAPNERMLAVQAATLRARRSLPQRAISTSIVQLAENMFGGTEGPQRRLAELDNRRADVQRLSDQGISLREGRAGLVNRQKALIQGIRATEAQKDPNTGKPMFDASEQRARFSGLRAEFIQLTKQSKLVSEAFNTGATEVEGLAKAAVTGSDILRNLGAGFVGGVAGGLVTGVLSQAVGAVTQVGGLALDKALGNIQEISATRQQLGAGTRAAGGRADVAVAQAAAATGLSSAAFRDISPTLDTAAAVEAGNTALNDQLNQFRLFEDSQKRGVAAGVTQTLGGAFGSFIGGTAPAAETMGAFIGEAGAFRVPRQEPRGPANNPLELLNRTLFGEPADMQPKGQVSPDGFLMTGDVDKLHQRIKLLNDGLDKSGKSLVHFADTTDFTTEQLAKQAAELDQAGAPQLASVVRGGQAALVDQAGGLAGAGDILAAIQQMLVDAARPSAEALIKAQAPQRQAQIGVEDAQLGLALQQNKQSFAIGRVAQPLPTGEQLAKLTQQGLSSADSPQVIAAANQGLTQTQQLYEGINKQISSGLEDARAFVAVNLPGQAQEFAASLAEVQSLGTKIAGIQIGLQTKQAAYSAAQFTVQIGLAKRALSDAKGLAGQAFGANNLGAIERQSFMLGRQGQSLDLEQSQRQINFQVASAGFAAPGDTAEERSARIAEAKIEAELAQKKHDIAEGQFGLAGQAFDVQAGRGVTDAGNQLELAVQGRAVAKASEDAARQLEGLSASLAKEQADVAAIYGAASQRAGDVIGWAGELVAAGATANDKLLTFAAALEVVTKFMLDPTGSGSGQTSPNVHLPGLEPGDVRDIFKPKPNSGTPSTANEREDRDNPTPVVPSSGKDKAGVMVGGTLLSMTPTPSGAAAGGNNYAFAVTINGNADKSSANALATEVIRQLDHRAGMVMRVG